MNKLILVGVLITSIFTGCTVNKQPEPKEVVKEEINQEIQENQVVIQEEVKEKIEEVQEVKNIPFKFYKVIPQQIEVFPYNRLYSTNIIDDKKLNDSFYIKGQYVRIEKIYTSKIGDKYGKIVGKNLLVSMDDLTASNK